MSSTKPSKSGLEKVLAQVGRASTPTVPVNETGLTLSRLLNQRNHLRTREVRFYGVIGGVLRDELQLAGVTFKCAIPGDSFESLPNDFSGIVLIDRSAFVSGPWFSVESESGIRLREEIYELCRHARSNGIPVWFLDEPSEESFAVIRIKSACDVSFPYAEVEDFVEEAPVNDEFTVVTTVVGQRFDSKDMS